MRSRALGSATADLFATAAIAAAHPRAAPRPAPAGTTPPPHAYPARARPRHLWYAVVFAELGGAPCLEPARTAVVLQRLCLHAQQFTPLVSIEMPNALLLEIRGSVKLFGSLEILHARIDETWRRLELSARSATAPSTLAALWLARAGRRELIEDAGSIAGKLAALPVTCTAWDAERLEALRALGILRIGEVLRLPRAGMTRRFGASLMLDLDIALARQAAPRRAFEARERFRERCNFEAEVETVVYLEKALEPLLAHCAKFLRERQAGVQALELRLRHRNSPVTRVRFGLASVTGEERRLADVLSQRLSQLELAAPIVGLTLVSGPLQPLAAACLDVFAHPGRRAGGRDTAPQLVERLRARLGETAVYGICAVAEHRPEAAWQRVQALRLDTVRPGERRPPPPLDPGMPRPVLLLNEPAELSISQIRQLDCGEMILEEGPERIESGWWDGKEVARDYYVVRQAGGMRLWIFQERRSKHWFLHGVFA
jgi:protein ImuB